MKRLTISANRQQGTVAFGIEAYKSRKLFMLFLNFWPMSATVRYGEPPTEVINLREYDAA